MVLTSAGSVVEYYLVRPDSYFKVEWVGPDPSFVMLAPIHPALEEHGVFTADAAAVWPGVEGEPYFYIDASQCDAIGSSLENLDWNSQLSPVNIRDTLSISDEHAQELTPLARREADRLVQLCKMASDKTAGLLCVVY